MMCQQKPAAQPESRTAEPDGLADGSVLRPPTAQRRQTRAHRLAGLAAHRPFRPLSALVHVAGAKVCSARHRAYS